MRHGEIDWWRGGGERERNTDGNRAVGGRKRLIERENPIERDRLLLTPLAGPREDCTFIDPLARPQKAPARKARADTTAAATA